MPYELLYSRTITGDSVVRYTDVPITDKSVMIEVLSLLSPFRRIAGYAYALRSDGISDYERSGGVTLPFGKNRVTFASATLPYGLEFFPKWGMKTGVISVYIGEPGSPPPPPEGWKAAANGIAEFRLAQNPNRIEYRQPVGSSVIRMMAPGALEGVEFYGYVGWKKADGSYWWTESNNLTNENVDTETGYRNLRNGVGAVLF